MGPVTSVSSAARGCGGATSAKLVEQLGVV